MIPQALKMNAAKVKAAQDPNKKGAEKPDLGAPGKKPKLAGFSPKKKPVEKVAKFDGQCPPNVKIDGQVNDAIDDSYLNWMNKVASEGVPVFEKDASKQQDALARLASAAKPSGKKKLLLGAGALTATGLTALAMKKREKTAGVILNPENDDLLKSILKKAGAQTTSRDA